MKQSKPRTLDAALTVIARLESQLAKSNDNGFNANDTNAETNDKPLNLPEALAVIQEQEVVIAALQKRVSELEKQIAAKNGGKVDPKTPTTHDDSAPVTEESLAAAIHVEKDFRKQNAMVRTLAAMQLARATAAVSSKRRSRQPFSH